MSQLSESFRALQQSKGCADLAPKPYVVELPAVPCYEDRQPHHISAMDPDIRVSVSLAAPKFS
jgi:hypothetical protein